MGADPSAPRPSRSLASIAKGLRTSYPEIVRQLGQQELPAAQYDIATQEAIAPREQALAAGLYGQYAPQYAQTGSNIDLGAIQGAGGQAVRAADTLQRGIEPEYFASRAAASQKLQDLLGGMDPNRLTEPEREEVARGLARSNYTSGELSAPSNQGAINAAQTFGSALTAKRNNVANAINTAAQALPQFRTGTDAFAQATGGARFGAQNASNAPAFTGQSQQSGQILGQGALGLTGQLQTLRAQLQAQRRDEIDRTNEAFNAVGSII